MKVYDFILTKDSKGVFAMSLVKSGAMKNTFIKLAEEEPSTTQVDEDERVVTGVAMQPDKLIYRKDIDGEEAYIKFSKETIKEASYRFISGDKSNMSTLEHSINTDSVRTIESWIVVDPKNDKANALGLEVTEGSWVLSQRILDDELWKDVKSGDYNGFSIEGGFSKVALSEDVKASTDNLKEIDSILNQL